MQPQPQSQVNRPPSASSSYALAWPDERALLVMVCPYLAGALAMSHLIFAQASLPWSDLFRNKELLTLVVGLTAVAVGVLYAFVRAVFHHRERMAMIQQGMMPYGAEE